MDDLIDLVDKFERNELSQSESARLIEHLLINDKLWLLRDPAQAYALLFIGGGTE